jgi:hypothetical protein
LFYTYKNKHIFNDNNNFIKNFSKIEKTELTKPTSESSDKSEDRTHDGRPSSSSHDPRTLPPLWAIIYNSNESDELKPIHYDFSTSTQRITLHTLEPRLDSKLLDRIYTDRLNLSAFNFDNQNGGTSDSGGNA